mmetsp:Transcript_12629/g.25756  ORF Transcript_12629/g.25756 Transcript_12629/m.25756 type:complete len:507 (-) Transcript_12629:275-1795(-)|eukprot:CAMPEP_0167825264 /NCGR_PEP_ID=MMETSP0112_2-20121227/9267_1 /TAXON_ID=91324 /ORGANISM="Lotharella globosa, Strain CCCM811" /LENGTH=506 /DNA_ID=CAMNT_0007727347 /DNA_START=20 /DNA_END=1540 /DNA_ORIENTATION=-
MDYYSVLLAVVLGATVYLILQYLFADPRSPPYSDWTGGFIDLVRLIRTKNRRGISSFVEDRVKALGTPTFKVRVPLLGLNHVFVTDPDDQKRLAQSERKLGLSNDMGPAWKDLHGDDLMAMSGKKHKHWRRIFSRVLTRDAFEGFTPVILEEVTKMIDRMLMSKDPIPLKNQLQITQLRTMGRLLYGIDFDKELEKERFDQLVIDFELILGGLFGGPGKKKGVEARARQMKWLGGRFRRILEERKAIMKRRDVDDEKRCGEKKTARNAMEMVADALLEDEEGPTPENFQIALDNLYLFLEASHSTSIHATTATFGFLLSEGNENILADVKKELQAVKEFSPEAEKTELAFSQGCITEAMRLCPITSIVSFRLPKGQVFRTKDHTIRGPETIALEQNSNLLNPKYFPNPTEYIPLRWIPGNKHSLSLASKAASNPFGYGAHYCMGYNLAYFNIKATLHTMFTRADVSYQLTEPLEFETRMFPSMQVKNGLLLRVEKQENLGAARAAA